MAGQDKTVSIEVTPDNTADGILYSETVPQGEVWYVEQVGVYVEDGDNYVEIRVEVFDIADLSIGSATRGSYETSSADQSIQQFIHGGALVEIDEQADDGGSGPVHAYARMWRVA